MDFSSGDEMSRDQILLNRLALVESRLQALAELCAPAWAAERAGGDSGLPNDLLIDADSQLELATGFYLREWDAAGRPFRWAGRADYFEFRFFLDRSAPRPFLMRGILAENSAPDALHAYADYRPVPLRIAEADGMFELAGRIPADPLGAGVTLTFFAEPVAQRGSDTRRLSFAFSTLAVGDAAATSRQHDQPQRNRA